MALFLGISFPFRPGDLSFPAESEDADLIKDAIRQLLGTGKGERVMRPTFGCNALNYVFESNNGLLTDMVSHEVATAIGRFESRIMVKSIKVARDAAAASLTVDIFYVIVATRQEDQVSVTLSKQGS
jgi:phage baseplate assembly protein W